jgi:hypothetical protein
MRRRWEIVLPMLGLILFASISYHSYRQNRAIPGRFFLWSTLRLDSDPLGRRHPSPCAKSESPCVGWDVATIDSWARPNRMERLFVLSALPAFVIGIFVTFGLGRFGVSEVLSYMISMPLLISAWFYFVGWIIDRWRFKRSHLTSAAVADKS